MSFLASLTAGARSFESPTALSRSSGSNSVSLTLSKVLALLMGFRGSGSGGVSSVSFWPSLESSAFLPSLVDRSLPVSFSFVDFLGPGPGV